MRAEDKAACTGAKAKAVDAETKATLVAALQATAKTDRNPYMRDIIASNHGTVCSTRSSTVGISVDVGGVCWTHVHEDLLNVYDFTYWTLEHPGNVQRLMNGERNPISMWAERGSADIWFPSDDHSMRRWYDAQKILGGYRRVPLVGRAGDFVEFSALSSGLQTIAMANLLNATTVDTKSGGFEACGSPGEVANVPEKGNHYYFLTDIFTNYHEKFEADVNFIYPAEQGKQIVWTNVVLKAKDQLRQRVAWALSQIMVVANNGGKSNQHVI